MLGAHMKANRSETSLAISLAMRDHSFRSMKYLFEGGGVAWHDAVEAAEFCTPPQFKTARLESEAQSFAADAHNT
jgi:hypothetical protein